MEVCDQVYLLRRASICKKKAHNFLNMVLDNSRCPSRKLPFRIKKRLLQQQNSIELHEFAENDRLTQNEINCLLKEIQQNDRKEK